jgi:hypothetical protein
MWAEQLIAVAAVERKLCPPSGLTAYGRVSCIYGRQSARRALKRPSERQVESHVRQQKRSSELQ